jgi:hypothetical protein
MFLKPKMQLYVQGVLVQSRALWDELQDVRDLTVDVTTALNSRSNSKPCSNRQVVLRVGTDQWHTEQQLSFTMLYWQNILIESYRAPTSNISMADWNNGGLYGKLVVMNFAGAQDRYGSSDSHSVL